MTSLPARALIEKLQKTAKCIYIATDKVVADDVSATCNEAATALLSAHSELERVREALEKTGTQLSVTLQWIDNWNPSFAEDEEWRGDRRLADEAVQSARAALSPQPPKEEK